MLKEKIKNGASKVKTFVKDHKKKLIKGGVIAGGTAIGVGLLGAFLNHNEGFVSCDEDLTEDSYLEEPSDDLDLEDSDVEE